VGCVTLLKYKTHIFNLNFLLTSLFPNKEEYQKNQRKVWWTSVVLAELNCDFVREKKYN